MTPHRHASENTTRIPWLVVILFIAFCPTASALNNHSYVVDWETPLLAGADTCYPEEPCLAFDDDGTAYLVWSDEATGDWELYFQAVHANGTAGDVSQLTDNGATSHEPTLALGPNGRLHLAWADDRHGNYEIYYVELNTTGDNTTAPHRVTTSAGDSVTPQLAVDSKGIVSIFWADNRTGDFELYYDQRVPPKPDLTISAVTVNETLPHAGSTVKVTATVTNTGIASARHFYVRLATGEGTVLINKYISSNMSSGEGLNVSATWNATLAPTTITATADATDAVDELYESNNAAAINVSSYGLVENSSFSTDAHNQFTLADPASGASLILAFTDAVTTGSVSLRLDSSCPLDEDPSIPHLALFANASLDASSTSILSWAYLCLPAADSDIADAGIDADGLGLYWFNETGADWERLSHSAHGWVTSVATANNRVCANLTHLSLYVGGGQVANPPTLLAATDDSSSSTPTAVGNTVTFTASWADLDTSTIRLYVCNSSEITAAGCSGRQYCTSNLTAANPASCTYTAAWNDTANMSWYAAVCDGTSSCSSPSTRNEFSVNHPPSTTHPLLSPASIYHNSRVVCNAGVYNDADGDSPGAHQWQWFLDGEQLAGATTQYLNCSAYTSCRGGTEIRCAETPVDGHGAAGTPVNSSAKNVTNTAPSIATATITPALPQSDDDLVCANGSVSDAEGDPITLHYRWYRNYSVVSGFANHALPSDNHSSGDYWSCGVIPSDGTSNGSEARSQVVLIDGGQPAPAINESTANATEEDPVPVGGTVGVSSSWTATGTGTLHVCSTPSITAAGCVDDTLCTEEGSQSTLSCSYIVPDQDGSSQVVYSFICEDSMCSGSKTASISLNHAPTLLSPPTISPATVYAPSESFCLSGVFYDADGDDTGTHSWTWYLDGDVISGAESQSLAGHTAAKGEELICRQIPSDEEGLVGSAENSTAKLVANSPPVIDAIPAQTAYVDLAYSYQVSASDADDDVLTYTDDTGIFNVNPSTGLISFAPQAGDLGSYTILLSADDGEAQDTETLSLTVTEETQTTLALYPGWNLMSLGVEI